MNLPSRRPPVSRAVWRRVLGLPLVLGVKQHPAAHSYPTPQKLISQCSCGPVRAPFTHDVAPARCDLNDHPCGAVAVHGIEHQLNVAVATCVISGTAIRAFNAAAFHVPDVANNFRPFLYLPTANVISWGKDPVKRDCRIYLSRIRRGVPVLEPVECPNAQATRVALHAAAVEYLKTPPWSRNGLSHSRCTTSGSTKQATDLSAVLPAELSKPRQK